MIAHPAPEDRPPRVDLAEIADFDLGGMRVSPAHRQVCMNGEQRELEPRVAQVLVALASARPGVVSRDRLIEQCWDGRIVGDDALNRCIVALRQLAKEFSPQPFAIETVPRVGYSLIERSENGAGNGVRGGRNRVAILALLAVLLIASGVGLSWSWLRPVQSEPASIAVLPFRNLSGGEPYFAQGIGEEILAQLAREPQFRVAGSTSTSQAGQEGSVREAARRLNVDYVVEGNVRREGGRVRVNAGLLRASDGVRLWSDTYDGTLDNVLQIQAAIGEAVAAGLKRRLIHTPSDRRSVNGEAYALYLSARGLVRSGNAQSGEDSIAMLRQAIKLDPNFAPAWAALADALQLGGRTKGTDGLIAVLPQAQGAARHALKLDPDLAEGHVVLAKLLGNDSPEAVVHLKRAADLAPRTAEGQIAAGDAHFISGEYAQGLAAYRRAQDLEPLWPGPGRILVNAHSLMGDRSAAEGALKHAFPNDPMGQHHGLARLAWNRGDFSEAARHWSVVASEPSSPWASPAKLSIEDIAFMLRLSKDPPSRPPRPQIGQFRVGPRAWINDSPSPTEWRTQNRSFAASLVNHDVNVVGAKRMLLAGRARELVATYDSPSGLLYMRPGVRMGVCDLHEAAIVALALQGAGRRKQADALLREADSLLKTVYRRGEVPGWFDEDAAALWAVQGKSALAVAALKRAFNRGAVHVGRSDFPRLEDEPAFRSLQGDRRFEALIAQHRAHFARERAETARVLKVRIS